MSSLKEISHSPMLMVVCHAEADFSVVITPRKAVSTLSSCADAGPFLKQIAL